MIMSKRKFQLFAWLFDMLRLKMKIHLTNDCRYRCKIETKGRQRVKLTLVKYTYRLPYANLCITFNNGRCGILIIITNENVVTD